MGTMINDSATSRPTSRGRWPHAGRGQGRLLLAALGIIVAAFLPWVNTAFGSFTGLAGPGVWTLYAGVLGIAGALVRRRRLAKWHALVVGVTALGLSLWQLARLAQVCTLDSCLPGAGLLLTLAGGGVALHAAYLLHVPELERLSDER